MKLLFTVFFAVVGVALAQEVAVTTAPKFDIWAILGQFWAFVRDNPVVFGPVVTYLLTLVPGPLKAIFEALIRFWTESATKTRAEDAVKSAYDANKRDLERVMPEERKAEINEKALRQATQIAIDLGVPQNEAETRVRSAFRTLKTAGEVK
ncbi:MAG: hypothetical protein ACRC1W_11375 [Shewanella sp.]